MRTLTESRVISGLQVVRARQVMGVTSISGPGHLGRPQNLWPREGLSLHRSEGFGRGMAEALQLGVDVIANDYGRNTDFCADGHVWGEPDLEHAAELMQQVVARRLTVAADPEVAA